MMHKFMLQKIIINNDLWIDLADFTIHRAITESYLIPLKEF